MRKRIKLLTVFILLCATIVMLFWYFYAKVAYTPFGYVRSDWVEVSPRIDGYIDKIMAPTDTHVEKDSMLMTIYSYPFELVVEQLKADVGTEEAQLEELKALLADLQKQIEIMKIQVGLMKEKKDRQEKLNAEGSVVSLDSYQTVWINYQQTSLNFAELITKKNNMEKKISVQERTIESTKAKLAQAEYNLSETKILAPFSGWITNNYVMPGQYIKTGSPLCGLRSDKCWIEMNYKEWYVGRLHPGMKAYVQTDIYPFEIFTGKIESVISAVNRGNSNNMTLPYIEPTIDWVRLQYRFTVRIKLDKLPDDVVLRMGSNARCWIPLGR